MDTKFCGHLSIVVVVVAAAEYVCSTATPRPRVNEAEKNSGRRVELLQCEGVSEHPNVV